MKGLIGLLVTAALGVGIYLYSLKMASPGPGMVATQAISTTGVQNDLIGIAQAERMYFAQNSSYADLATLSSSGTMNIARTGRRTPSTKRWRYARATKRTPLRRAPLMGCAFCPQR